MTEVNFPGDIKYNGVGFRSRQSVTGNFSHTFTTPGTYYYITEGYAHIGTYYLVSDIPGSLTLLCDDLVIQGSMVASR